MNKEINWYFEDKDGEITQIPLERWAWQAMLKDGTEIRQFDKVEYEPGKARFHQIGELDMSKVAVFEMVNTEDPSKRFSIVASPDITKFLVFTRRTVLEATTPNETRVSTYCFGYMMGNTPVYHFILPDDRVVITTNRNIPLISQQ